MTPEGGANMENNTSKIENDARLANLTNMGKGRPKGAQNKVTMAAKEAIALAADRLGGVDRLVEWVQEDTANERVFWGSVYPKLLPLQVNGAGENGEHLHDAKIVIELVRPNAV